MDVMVARWSRLLPVPQVGDEACAVFAERGQDQNPVGILIED
jgi:hypothetical protein